MARVGEYLAEMTRRLACVTDTPRLDAEYLLAHTLQCSRGKLLTRLDTKLASNGAEELLKRRLAHEPIPYILGEWEFYSVPLFINTPVLVPRPETEHLVEAALHALRGAEARVLDLCTGSGCVALAIALNTDSAAVVGTDLHPASLALAERNLRRHGLADRVPLYQGDMFDALPRDTQPFDIIVCNPPYVEAEAYSELSPTIRLHEDPGALIAGKDGLDHIRRLIREAPGWLKAGGTLAIEIGMGQDGRVAQLLQEMGYTHVKFVPDLANIPRIAVAERPRP